jgi:DNA modification methylase
MITDPPYNVGYHYNEYHDAMSDAEYWTFLGSVLRMPLVFIHYPEQIFPLAKQLTRTPDKLVAWVYHANTPKQWRAIAWFGLAPDLSLVKQPYRNPDDKRIRELMLRGSPGTDVYDWWPIEQVKNVNLEKTEHPCQIPTAVMMQALQVTPFDGPVIDPFCGSGTTLLAAQELGRQAIGIESSEGTAK